MCRKHINNRSYTQTFKSIFFFATCVFSGSSFAETINVTDEAGLRAALIQVTTNGENDVIDLGGNTIVLSYDPVTGQGGQLISLPEIVEEGIQGKTITIQNGTIERDENAPPFRLLAAPRIAGNDTLFHSLKLTNMVFKNGIADISDPATVNVNPGIPGFARGGGAVFGGRRLSIFNCQFINNRVISDPDGDPLYGGKVYGGAVYATYQFFAGRSEFIDNRIDVLPGREGLGGAVSVSAENGTSQTLFRNNSATSGGAIYGLNSGMEIKDSTFEGNSAAQLGGAVWSGAKERQGLATIERSTFVGNNAGDGGGAIYLQPSNSIELRHITVWGNSASGQNGGGIRFVRPSDGGTITLFNSIVGNNAGANCAEVGNIGAGVLGVSRNNLTTDVSCGSDGWLVVSDPGTVLSDVLEDNEYADPVFTQTLALVENSPAVDAGNAADCYFSDQRKAQPFPVGVCDIGAFELTPRDLDTDGDGVNNEIDNCPSITNETQADADLDGMGDVCDFTDNADDDGDGVENFADNCISILNPSQEDADDNGIGDACDDEDDDGVFAVDDNCPLIGNPGQEDLDADGVGDACDTTDNRPDTDGDGVVDALDNCPTITNAGQEDADGNFIGDACDDEDDDGFFAVDDNCPLIGNPGQEDLDGDGLGDACDTTDNRPDTDGDGVVDALDNCPAVVNAGQEDADGNGIGDVCEENSVDGEINPAIETAANDLDGVIDGTDGSTRRVLRNAARDLDNALLNRNWTSDNALSESRGNRVFNRIAQAVNSIESIADRLNRNSALRAELDAITSSLMDSMRSLAADQIAAAIVADGTANRIARARQELASGDRRLATDWLSGATREYRNAWRLASQAF